MLQRPVEMARLFGMWESPRFPVDDNPLSHAQFAVLLFSVLKEYGRGSWNRIFNEDGYESFRWNGPDGHHFLLSTVYVNLYLADRAGWPSPV